MNELKNKTVFSLFTKEDIENQSFYKEIENIISKHNILKNDNELFSSRDKNYILIINHILHLKKEHKEIENDLKSLFLYNTAFKKDVNSYLYSKLNSLTEDDSRYIFKDMFLLLTISSIGSNIDVIDFENGFNLKFAGLNFRFYEEHLQNLKEKNQETLFNLSFETYMILLKTLIEFCTISSLDFRKKFLIRDIFELITESVNIIKYNIKLNDIQLSKINTLQGRFLYIFSHLNDIIIYKNDLNQTFVEFLVSFSRQEDGFILASNNNFQDEISLNYKDEFFIYKYYSTIFVLKLLKRLQNIDNNLYFKNPYFKKIMQIYYKRFALNDEYILPNNIEELKTDLVQALVHFYKMNIDSQNKNYKNILEDFILQDKNYKNSNLEIIYRVLYFCDKIEDFQYSHISKLLIDSPKINNGYFEFFKLSIIDIYLKKIKYKKLDKDELILLENISNYCSQNSFDKHLHPVCSNIYINISYIFINNKSNRSQSLELFIQFLLLHGYAFTNNKYRDESTVIIKELDIEQEFIKKELLYNYFVNKNKEFADNANKIFITKVEKSIKIKNLSDLIQNKIFYNLANISIYENNKNYIQEFELNHLNIKINDKYSLSIAYTKQNEDRINLIYIICKDFILDILISLLKEEKSNFSHYLDNDGFLF